MHLNPAGGRRRQQVEQVAIAAKHCVITVSRRRTTAARRNRRARRVEARVVAVSRAGRRLNRSRPSTASAVLEIDQIPAPGGDRRARVFDEFQTAPSP